MATASTAHKIEPYLTSHSLHNDENRQPSENTGVLLNGNFLGHSVSAVRASSLQDGRSDRFRLAERSIGSQFIPSPPVGADPGEWRVKPGQLCPQSQWTQSPSSSTFSTMGAFPQLAYALPSVSCSLPQYHAESPMDQIQPQFAIERGQLPCVYSSLQSYQCLMPETVSQQTPGAYALQYPLTPSSTSATFLAGCPVSEAACPKPDHRAAHVLTVLRSSQGSSPPCFIGGATTICQQQICTKDDCPPDTKFRCPSEDIEAQQCPGDCAGRLCNGAGCPYNTTCALAQTAYEHPKVPNNDMWICGLTYDTTICSPPARNGSITKQVDFNGNMASLHSRDYSLACNFQKHPPEQNGLSQHHIADDFGCPLSQGCDFLGICEADPCDYNDFCHNQFQWDQCMWDDCSSTTAALEGGGGHAEVSRLPSSPLEIVSDPPSAKSASAVPSMPSESKGGVKHMATACLWIVDRSSGQLCGFSCDHCNDLQSHIERTHIEPQVVKSESGQKRASSRVPKSLLCRWEGCKHNEQKKTFRQTQALKQHVITHSRCMCFLSPCDKIRAYVNTDKSAQCPVCGQMCVDKANLEIHMRTHTGEKPYKCKYCDDCFAARSTLSECSLDFCSVFKADLWSC